MIMKRIGLFLLALTLFVGAFGAKTPVTIHKDSVKEVKIDKTVNDEALNLDSASLAKLSSEQIVALETVKLGVEAKRIEAENGNQIPLPAFIIFLICALPFLFAGIVIVVNVRAKKEESKRRYDLYTKSIEMGQTVPEHFFDQPKKVSTTSNLKRGVLWLAVGLAVLVSFLVMHKQDALILGIVPAFVGAGYLLVHFLDKPKSDSTAE
jgi:hypothetical protein